MRVRVVAELMAGHDKPTTKVRRLREVTAVHEEGGLHVARFEDPQHFIYHVSRGSIIEREGHHTLLGLDSGHKASERLHRGGTRKLIQPYHRACQSQERGRRQE
jgi:hypothetical protein